MCVNNNTVNCKDKTLEKVKFSGLFDGRTVPLYILLFVTKYFNFALIDIVMSPDFIVFYAVWKLVFY